MGITLAIAISTGIIGGFLASRLPFPEHFFDDQDHFHECEYGDDTAQFNRHHEHEGKEKTSINHETELATAKGH
jgi:hypothetical protein